ncbi:hypothetical protein MmiHf6_10520 [Methanimicrococcus hongohii]|uniref:Lj965 prophage protein n=1 Tax=Methanimicrococcus hongohii TaxID=3028295 RepID=A0AA96ZUG1_9EURY|nr:hypothetical protein [Methanimicrococcus sp. Hf6]WNY23737.1 hypothetical protein MmiHf6_10520 [Methanimicrococcus sp. Hf6]
MSTLTNEEAKNYCRMEKKYLGNNMFYMPGEVHIPLHSVDRECEFILTVRINRVELTKASFQNRVRKSVVLLRIDLGGRMHRNPNHEDVPCPHIHIYKDGYDARWAYPLPSEFSDPSDAFKTLQEFMDYCNITLKPPIQKGLELY